MIIVGVGGGSGSGKTYLCSKIKEELPEKTLVFSMDRYYRPFNDKDDFERQQINFDKPETLDWELMKEHLEQLRNRESIRMPEYSYEKNTRVGYSEKDHREIILVEGIHAFHDEKLNQLMDLKVFLDPEPDIRAVRRMKRDVVERNRNPEFAARQYIEKTREAHHRHVEPTKQRADIILDRHQANIFIEKVIDLFQKQEAARNQNLQKFIESEM